MNVIERLAQSAKVNHGLQLEPRNVKEIVTILQGMQMQIAADQGRSDALTRILAVCLNQIGGTIDIEPELFADAEHYAVNVKWDEDDEGAIIHATLTRSEVDVPEVPKDSEATSGGGSNLMPVSKSEDRREAHDESDDPDEEG